MSTNIQDLREDYQQSHLLLADVNPCPVEQFNVWFEQAVAANIKEPNAMTLATANQSGRPSARIVLLKGVTENSFVFYTNYDSGKGRDLAQNPYAALVFNWLELEKQIRIEGEVRKLDRDASEAYFQSRPKGSQIGAWASPQSRIIPDRSVLEDKAKALKEEYLHEEQLPCPPHWGGFEVIPDRIEFWQGRSSRLHDRIAYALQVDGSWRIDRLAP
ncbi:MAG: pyridoxamine 5'-phosphate oxidase [Bacteroidota bacterium]